MVKLYYSAVDEQILYRRCGSPRGLEIDWRNPIEWDDLESFHGRKKRQSISRSGRLTGSDPESPDLPNQRQNCPSFPTVLAQDELAHVYEGVFRHMDHGALHQLTHLEKHQQIAVGLPHLIGGQNRWED